MSTLTVSNITASNISGLSALSLPTLQSANVHLEATGNNRFQLVSSNTIAIVAAGANAIVANSTVTVISAAGANAIIANTTSIRAAGLTSLTGTTVATIVDPTIPTSGSAILSPKVSFAAVNSTSGTNIDFTGIPSWVESITVMFSGVSTNGTNAILFQLGTSSGLTTSGYVGGGARFGTNAVAGTSFTAGFGLNIAAATDTYNGAIVITNITGNTWVAQGNFGTGTTSIAFTTAGSIALAAVLDRVRITTVNGTDAFDAGIINVMYE